MKMPYLLLIISLFASITKAEERIAIAFYDVGKLYDTIPSNFYNDKSYTPKGRKRWTSERYNHKVDNIVAVIDSMRMPIIALYGVENHDVVRDIVSRSAQDYSYIHRTIDYYDGLDFALLYYGDRLFIDNIYATNHNIVIDGEIDNRSISIHMTRVGTRLRTVEPIENNDPADINIAWGKLSREDLKRLNMEDTLRETERQGGGDTKGKISWEFKNRLGITSSQQYKIESGVYITEWLLTTDRRAPLPTFSTERYFGGYSNHLPLYLYIINEP